MLWGQLALMPGHTVTTAFYAFYVFYAWWVYFPPPAAARGWLPLGELPCGNTWVRAGLPHCQVLCVLCLLWWWRFHLTKRRGIHSARKHTLQLQLANDLKSIGHWSSSWGRRKNNCLVNLVLEARIPSADSKKNPFHPVPQQAQLDRHWYQGSDTPHSSSLHVQAGHHSHPPAAYTPGGRIGRSSSSCLPSNIARAYATTLSGPHRSECLPWHLSGVWAGTPLCPFRNSSRLMTIITFKDLDILYFKLSHLAWPP
jgi:hypothetical protein